VALAALLKSTRLRALHWSRRDVEQVAHLVLMGLLPAAAEAAFTCSARR
jgi:hypothetical protein